MTYNEYRVSSVCKCTMLLRSMIECHSLAIVQWETIDARWIIDQRIKFLSRPKAGQGIEKIKLKDVQTWASQHWYVLIPHLACPGSRIRLNARRPFVDVA